jgi:hypothetical protein
MEGTQDEVVCAATASVQEATAARERDTVLIKEVEARFTVVEWEAQTTVAECEVRERMSKEEVESAASLASARREADGFARMVAF